MRVTDRKRICQYPSKEDEGERGNDSCARNSCIRLCASHRGAVAAPRGIAAGRGGGARAGLRSSAGCGVRDEDGVGSRDCRDEDVVGGREHLDVRDLEVRVRVVHGGVDDVVEVAGRGCAVAATGGLIDARRTSPTVHV